MEKYRVLIVEDDEDINNILKTHLEAGGYEVLQAFSGSEARFYIDQDIDVFLLDLMLPGLTGEELIKEIRMKKDTPILVISGKTSIEDKVNVLELGADDYMIKPFEKREVLARVKVLLRRVKFQEESSTEESLSYKSIELNPKTMEVTVDGKEITLTQTEFMILYEFLKDPESVFSRDRLYDLVWGYDYIEGDNALTVHISHLRQKLRKATGKDIIVTVWGVGYKLAK